MGTTLMHRLQARKTLDPNAVHRLAVELGAGLIFLHDRDLVHGDVSAASAYFDELEHAVWGNAVLFQGVAAIAKCQSHGETASRNGAVSVSDDWAAFGFLCLEAALGTSETANLPLNLDRLPVLPKPLSTSLLGQFADVCLHAAPGSLQPVRTHPYLQADINPEPDLESLFRPPGRTSSTARLGSKHYSRWGKRVSRMCPCFAVPAVPAVPVLLWSLYEYSHDGSDPATKRTLKS
jgi:hypothetical protein